MAKGGLKDITVIVDIAGEQRAAKVAAELARVCEAHLTGIALAVDQIGEVIGQCRESVVVAVFLLDIRMFRDECRHMRPAIRGGCRRKDDGDRVR